MRQITGTHFNYFQVCHRKLWLFANSLQMEHTSDLVYEGKLIQEESYPQRAGRYEEIEISGIKVDYYDPKNKVIHEVKKSDKVEHAHEWQLKYYIHVLKNNGIEGVSGVLEYPKLRKRMEVFLSEVDEDEIGDMLVEIREIIDTEVCPPLIKKGICRNCSYYDFCYAGDVEEG
jgi:CRISPR-associated exonuclease Cas4